MFDCEVDIIPSLVVTASSPYSVTWYVTGLSNPFNTNYYIQVVLSNSPAVNDSPNPPSGIISTMSAIPGYSSTTTPSQTTTGGGAFSPGNTYLLYASAQAINGRYYQAGFAYVTMPSIRPNNYYWTYAGINLSNGAWVSGNYKQSGLGFLLTAGEWNGLCSRINSFRSYKNLPTYSFTSVSSGDYFYYWIFNQAVSAIAPMNPPTPPPTTVSSGNTIQASYLNQLINSLNSIP